MKNILSTNSNNWTALIARVALGLTILPHGAQKLFGWFGGNGFSGTIDFFTTQMNLPYMIALLIIFIEFFGSLFLIIGLLTRVSALGFVALFAGIVYTVHGKNGFFMNWGMQENKGEGWEYFIMLFGLAIIALISGGGKASVDAAITNKQIQSK